MPAVALLPFFPTCYHRVNPISPSPSFARRASPAFHPSASQPSFLSAFQIDGFTKEGQRGRTEGTETDIYMCTYIGKRKKKEKETWKTSETFVSFMPNLYSRPKQRFRIFFHRESIPVGPRSRIIAPAGKILDEILVARTWWMSTFEIYAPTDTKKARAGLRESTAWIQTGMGEGPTENSSSDF